MRRCFVNKLLLLCVVGIAHSGTGCGVPIENRLGSDVAIGVRNISHVIEGKGVGYECILFHLYEGEPGGLLHLTATKYGNAIFHRLGMATYMASQKQVLGCNGIASGGLFVQVSDRGGIGLGLSGGTGFVFHKPDTKGPAIMIMGSFSMWSGPDAGVETGITGSFVWKF